MKIFFYAGKCIPIHAKSLEERPLGGTETGVIHVARILQDRGHEVTVFTSHTNPPPSKPEYLHYSRLYSAGPCDIFVPVQEWLAVFAGIPCHRTFLWTGDGPEQYSNFGIGDKRSIERIDRLLTASGWHARALCEESGFPFEKTAVLGNGVHLPWFEGQETRLRRRLIYTSAPYRGLALAAPIYKELKRKYGDLEFHIFAGLNIYDREKPFEGPQRAQAEQMVRLFGALPGCTMHGNVRQPELAREYMRSAVYIYPNTVRETCCITALEAQAGGCPIVTSELGGLPETVGEGGVIIGGEPGSREYMQQFLLAVDRLLSDDAFWQECSRRGRERVEREYTWHKVAERFEGLIVSAGVPAVTT